jgi:TolB-like protein/Flp pilus assembly protein TadD
MVDRAEPEDLLGRTVYATAAAGPARVFVSYASQDATTANHVVAALEQRGLKCWIAPRDVVPGTLYADEIVGAINDATAVVLILSKQAVESPHVGKEIERASSKRRPIIALRTDSAPLTRALEYFLSESQWIDVLQSGIETAITALVSAVYRHLDAPAPSLNPTPSETAGRTRARLRVKWLTLTAAVLIVVGLAYIGVDRLRLSKPTAGGPRPAAVAGAVNEKSIAVLPFIDLSEKKDQEYFADGLAEEILNLLTEIPALSVVGRTSSFQFKGTNVDLRTIGEKLGAAYVLEGSVRKSSDHVRVSAQLISAGDGVHRWSNTYDRPLGDVLKLQDELAAGVARAMEITIGGDGLQSHTTTRNEEAYDLYLRGLHSMERYDREGFEGAANYFQQALDVDPTFAAAAAQLGRNVLFLAEFGFAPPRQTYERARQALQMAIKLDPSSSLAHGWLGWVHMAYDWNWEAADAEMKQALRLSPRDPVVLLCASRLAQALGHLDDAIRLLSSVLSRDPLYAAGSNNLSEVYARAGRLVEAEAAERRVLEISPTYASGPYNLAMVLLALGRSEEALQVITSRQHPGEDRMAGLAIAYHAVGRKPESDAQVAALIREHAADDAFEIAQVRAYRGEVDEAFTWLDRAYAQKDVGLYLIRGDLLLKDLVADPRYKAFLLKMKLMD